MSEIAKMLGGGTGRKSEVLTDDMRKELRVVDLNSEEGIKPPEPRKAIIPQKKPSRFNETIDALSSPAGQRFLGVMAKAFTQNNPNQAGTILGNAGIEQAEGRAIQNFASRLLAGEDVGDIKGLDVGGISPEGIAQAQSMTTTQEQGDRADRQLDQEDAMLQLEGRAMNLREDIQEFDEEVFRFEKGMSEDEMARKQQLLEIEEQNAIANRRYQRARADYYETQSDIMQGGDYDGTMDSLTPEQKAELFSNTESVVELLNVQAEPLEEQLRVVNGQLNRTEDPTRTENLQQEKEYIQNRLANLRNSQVQAMQKLGDIVGVDIEDMPEREEPVVAPSTEEEGPGFFGRMWNAIKGTAGGSNEETGTTEPVGSLNNPIVVPQGTDGEGFAEFFEQQEPGTIGQFNGSMYKKTEEGELIEL